MENPGPKKPWFRKEGAVFRGCERGDGMIQLYFCGKLCRNSRNLIANQVEFGRTSDVRHVLATRSNVQFPVAFHGRNTLMIGSKPFQKMDPRANVPKYRNHDGRRNAQTKKCSNGQPFYTLVVHFSTNHSSSLQHRCWSDSTSLQLAPKPPGPDLEV